MKINKVEIEQGKQREIKMGGVGRKDGRKREGGNKREKGRRRENV